MIVPLIDKTADAICECSSFFSEILNPVMDNGKYLIDMPSHKEIRNFVLHQIQKINI